VTKHLPLPLGLLAGSMAYVIGTVISVPVDAAPAEQAAPSEHGPLAARGAVRPDLVFRFGFDEAPRRVGDIELYEARGVAGSVGQVLTSPDGELLRVPGDAGAAVRFPPPCGTARCDRALVEVPHTSELNPGTAAFSFGASVLLRPDETTQGSNIVQKGRFRTPGGQWKLQADTLDGRPSCVFRGGPGRRPRMTKVTSPLSVATGTWHRVRCVKAAGRAAIVVDGLTTTVPSPVQVVANTAPVRLGSPGLARSDDQYHGRLDRVFLRIGPE
jgi:hypothetical protein